MKDAITLIGIAGAMGVIVFANVLEGGNPASLLLLPPMLLVWGATILISLAGGTMADAKAVPVSVKQAFLGSAQSSADVVPVVVGRSSGPEADARDARHAALDEAATTLGARAVLLGHTLDDQAEQVLLGLARGSGARSLSGMPARRGLLRRPLLALPRSDTVAICAAAGLVPWDDPTNSVPWEDPTIRVPRDDPTTRVLRDDPTDSIANYAKQDPLSPQVVSALNAFVHR